MVAVTPRRRKTDCAARRTAPLLAYLMIVAVIGLVFYTQERNNTTDERLRKEACASSVENREAIRQVYRDVAALGRTLGSTPERRAELREKLDQFERERLNKIPPLSVEDCNKR